MQPIEEFSIENFLKLAETLKEWGEIYSPLIMYIFPESYKKLEEKYHANPKNNSNSNQN